MITADVKVSSVLDRLVITPRQVSDSHGLSGILRNTFAKIRLHQSAEGVWIEAKDAHAFFNAAVPLDLRWSPEASAFVENRHRARQIHNKIQEEIRHILSGGKDTARDYLADIKGIEALDDHQWVNVASMTIPESFGLCLFDEQGAGKTVSLIFAYDVLVARDQIDFALIVAPKSMVPEWLNDFNRFKGDLYRVGLFIGSRRDKRAALASGSDVLITNFESTVSMEHELRSLLQSFKRRVMIVVDESFFIKNLNAKRTCALRRLREWCSRAFVLCGTPAPNTPHDLIQQFNITDFGLTFDGVDVPKDIVPSRPIVQQAIEERGLFVRHLKTDVLPGLPLKRFHRVLVPLQPQQERLYEAALRDLILDLRSIDDGTFQRRIASFFAKRSILLQICSNPTTVIEGYEEVPAKLDALDSLLEESIMQKREKVVLWSFYTASIDGIMVRYTQYHPVRYDGTISAVADRREAVRKFQEDNKTMLFVANPAAAGAGLTLHRARIAEIGRAHV